MGIWMTLGSLLLGLLSWFLPLVGLVRGKGWRNYMTASLAACAGSLLLVVLYLEYLVFYADWSALLDTMAAFRFVSVGLLVVTLLLNALLSVVRGRGRTARS